MDEDNTFEENGVEYGLVIPFVVVTSKGGPYDDDSFVAGWRAGVIDRRLEVHDSPAVEGESPIPVETALLPQLDLIAMAHGYQMKSISWEDGFWSLVTFTITE
jgi:hypothetical protein